MYKTKRKRAYGKSRCIGPKGENHVPYSLAPTLECFPVFENEILLSLDRLDAIPLAFA
jgi:hypothetical protein